MEDTVVFLTLKVFISVKFSITYHKQGTGKDHFRGEIVKINSLQEQKHWFLIHTWSDKAFKDTVVNHALHLCMEGHWKLRLQFLKDLSYFCLNLNSRAYFTITLNLFNYIYFKPKMFSARRVVFEFLTFKFYKKCYFGHFENKCKVFDNLTYFFPNLESSRILFELFPAHVPSRSPLAYILKIFSVKNVLILQGGKSFNSKIKKMFFLNNWVVRILPLLLGDTLYLFIRRLVFWDTLLLLLLWDTL